MRPRKLKSEATRARDGVVEPHTLLIAVNDPRIHGSDVLYKVAIMDPARPRTAIHTVDRSFSQLKPIIAKMRLIAPDAGLPEVTKSKMFGTQQPQYMEDRRASMEMFLNAVTDNRLLCYDSEFLEFVGFSEAAKERMARSALLLQLTATPTLSVFVQLLQQRGSMIDGEELIQSTAAAARSWLRGRQDFNFIRVLGNITHPRWVNKKINVLVEDGSRRQHVLTIQTVVSERGFLRPLAFNGAAGDYSPVDRLKRVKHMISHLSKHGSIFALPTVIEVMEDWVVSVRPFYPAGSLYDLLHDVRDPLSKGSLKYAQPGGGLPADTLQQVAQGVLQIIRACHEYNIPLPTLTMGNVMVEVDRSTRRVSVLLAGIEDLVSGNSWLPCVPPLDGIDSIKALLEADQATPTESDVPPKTNLDLLLFGAILYQCATGTVLDPEMLTDLLSVQGDPYVPPVALPSTAVSNVKHLFGGSQNSRLPVPKSILPEVLNLLHYLFHPTIPADIRILVHHSFLRMPSTDDGAPSGDGALPLRAKDVEIMEAIAEQWVGLWEKHRAKKEKLEQQKVEIKLGLGTESLSVGEGMKRKQSKKAISKKRDEELAAQRRPVTPPPPPPPATVVPSSAPKAPNMPTMSPQNSQAPPPPLSMEKTAPLPPSTTPPPPKRPPPPPPPPKAPPPKVAPPPPKKAH